jgi:hypothetical protein
MSNIITFKPRRELDAQSNLDAFVAFARDKLTTFGADLKFDAIVWDVTDVCARKGLGKKRERITFCTMDSAGKKNTVPLSDAFRPFAQAYIRQMQVLRPVVSLGQRMAALRALEAALVENGENFSPVHVDFNILNRAAQRIKEHFHESAAYKTGVQLKIIADYLTKHGLTVINFNWRNPIKRPLGGSRVGQEFDARRSKMMPSEAALEALPYIYRKAIEPRDVLVSATAAVLCSSPDRISEFLMLPEACETDGLIKGDGAYGLRWWPAKSAEPMVKWILPSMKGVVKEAIGKIRKVTEPARVVSRWYEENPDKIFLSSSLEELRTHDVISLAELREILWGDSGLTKSVRDWCELNNIQLKNDEHTQVVSFSDVERAVLNMLPSMFPILNREVGLNYSNSLMIVLKNTFRMNKPTYACVVEPVVEQQINDAMGARAEHGRKSIFDAFNCTEPDGRPIAVTSHQFRHYLNTLAQAGGLSQLDIAKWSGRKDIRQNEAYDHVSADEMLQIIREAVGDETKAVGPLANMPQQYLIKRDEFSRLLIPTAHTTDFGYCIHDYTMTPCQVHLDCINCQEHVCVKGDTAKTKRLRQQLEEAQNLLNQAESASNDGFYGSDRWLEHHRLTAERLRQLCAIMDDPKVPIGAVIQLNNIKSASRIKQAAITRAQLPTLPGDKDSMFEDFHGLFLGGSNKNEN